MKKAILILLALLLIGGGVYGTNYFMKLETAEKLIDQAILDFREKKYEMASNNLKTVISKFDLGIVLAPVYYLLGQVYTEGNLYQQAFKSYTEILGDQRLENQKLWKYQALIAISRLFRRKQVETSPEKILALKKYMHELIEGKEKKSSIAVTHSTGQTYEKVVSFLQKICSFNFQPDLEIPSEEYLIETLKVELGYLYLQNRDYQSAREMFFFIDNQSAKLGLARVYLETGEKDKALFILEELKDYDKSGKIEALYAREAFIYAEELYKAKKYSQAEEIFNKVIKTVPDSELVELALYYMARYNYEQKAYSAALKYIEQIMSNVSSLKDEEAQLLKGYINYHRGDYQAALNSFNQFIRMFPHSRKIKIAYQWKSLCERAIKYLN